MIKECNNQQPRVLMKVELPEPIEKMIREVVDAALKAAGSNAMNHAFHIFSWIDSAKAQALPEDKKFEKLPPLPVEDKK